MTAAGRRRRRTGLLTLAGALVAIFFLAPFSWLVLTSFMHEGDAMSVPLRLLPARPTLDNYATFVAPSGTRSIVGSRAAENTMPGIWNSLVAATGTAALNLALGILAGYSFRPPALPRQDERAPALPRLADGARHRPHRAALPGHPAGRPPRHPAGARRHLPDLHAAVHDLAPQELLPGHPPGARGGRPRGRLRVLADDGPGPAPRGGAGARRRRDVRVHDGLERLPVRGDPDVQHGRQDRAGRRGRASPRT